MRFRYIEVQRVSLNAQIMYLLVVVVCPFLQLSFLSFFFTSVPHFALNHFLFFFFLIFPRGGQSVGKLQKVACHGQP